MDGLSGLQSAMESQGPFQNAGVFEQTLKKPTAKLPIFEFVDLKTIVSFILGVVVSAGFIQLRTSLLSGSFVPTN